MGFKDKNRPILSVVNVVADVAFGLLVAVLLVSVVARHVFGVHAFCVLTGSMRPALEVGDLVVVLPSEYENIKVGDVVSYVMDEDLDIATHRVVEKNNADRMLVTKGDANESVDSSPVDPRNVVGVAFAVVPKVGHALLFLSGTTGKVVIVAAIVGYIVFGMLVRILLRMTGRNDARQSREPAHVDAPQTRDDEVGRRVAAQLAALDERAEAAGTKMWKDTIEGQELPWLPSKTTVDDRSYPSTGEKAGLPTNNDRNKRFLADGLGGDEYDANNCGELLSI